MDGNGKLGLVFAFFVWLENFKDFCFVGWAILVAQPGQMYFSLQIASSSMIRAMTWAFFQMATPTQPEKTCEKDMEDQCSYQPFDTWINQGFISQKTVKKHCLTKMDVLFLLLFFLATKNHTHGTVKLIVVRAFQCHMFLCVNGLVETLSPHTHPSFNNVWYVGWSLTFQFLFKLRYWRWCLCWLRTTRRSDLPHFFDAYWELRFCRIWDRKGDTSDTAWQNVWIHRTFPCQYLYPYWFLWCFGFGEEPVPRICCFLFFLRWVCGWEVYYNTSLLFCWEHLEV